MRSGLSGLLMLHLTVELKELLKVPLQLDAAITFFV